MNKNLKDSTKITSKRDLEIIRDVIGLFIEEIKFIGCIIWTDREIIYCTSWFILLWIGIFSCIRYLFFDLNYTFLKINWILFLLTFWGWLRAKREQHEKI